jgi:alpha-glucosidase (family GH31 glycosyl hydrolase)
VPRAGEGIESEPFRLYNLDVFEYEHDSPFGLYGSIPVLLAHKAGATVGAFWCAAIACVDSSETLASRGLSCGVAESTLASFSLVGLAVRCRQHQTESSGAFCTL